MLFFSKLWVMENITPENIVKFLEKHGTKITVEEAAKVLEFMQLLANLTLEQYFKK
jgi:hypothetical protein